jgi:hypothetical protein
LRPRWFTNLADQHDTLTRNESQIKQVACHFRLQKADPAGISFGLQASISERAMHSIAPLRAAVAQGAEVFLFLPALELLRSYKNVCGSISSMFASARTAAAVGGKKWPIEEKPSP